ncbi:MAG TPA: S8 family peptidase, partial [Acidimicrobiia bacterium]|nr:S8 family peptidase [Acidimicrobiia bacterium]
WGGASAVNIYRNGSSVAIASNVTEDPFVDTWGEKGGGTTTYRVCDVADSTVCAEATVVW